MELVRIQFCTLLLLRGILSSYFLLLHSIQLRRFPIVLKKEKKCYSFMHVKEFTLFVSTAIPGKFGLAHKKRKQKKKRLGCVGGGVDWKKKKKKNDERKRKNTERRPVTKRRRTQREVC